MKRSGARGERSKATRPTAGETRRAKPEDKVYACSTTLPLSIAVRQGGGETPFTRVPCLTANLFVKNLRGVGIWYAEVRWFPRVAVARTLCPGNRDKGERCHRPTDGNMTWLWEGVAAVPDAIVCEWHGVERRGYSPYDGFPPLVGQGGSPEIGAMPLPHSMRK